MQPESTNSPTAREIYFAALELDTSDAQREYIDEICGTNQPLKALVNSLLEAHHLQQTSPLIQFDEQFNGQMNADDDSDFESAPDQLIGNCIGRYEVIRRIGEGGMGIVYVANQSEPVRRDVALKVIRPGMDTDEVVSRFEAERQALALMDHPNIARALDAGATPQGRPFFVMELVEGKTITAYCKANQLTIAQRINLFISICDAVHHAHLRGVIHRDLKPSNVIVKEVDGVPIPKVIDFGVAKALTAQLTHDPVVTQQSQILGTPMYMSPEQARLGASDIDIRSDVYSLGVLLYELITDVPPFGRDRFIGQGTETIREMLLDETPIRPSAQLNQSTNRLANGRSPQSSATDRETANSRPTTEHLRVGFRNELDWIAMKCLEKDRERRYDSARQLAEDLERYRDGHPLLASPPSVRYRLRKFCARHWVWITISLVFLLSVISGGGVATWQAYIADQARREALRREQQALELLEASRIQNLLSAFREQNRMAMSRRELPRVIVEDHQPRRDQLNDGSLRDLLTVTATPRPAQRFQFDAAIHDVTMTADGRMMAVGDDDGHVHLVDLMSGTRQGTLKAHNTAVNAVAFSADGRKLAAGGRLGKVAVWRLNQDFIPLGTAKMFGLFPTGVETLKWSPDGRCLAAGARYSAARVWRDDSELLFEIENDHRHEAMLFSADSKFVYIPTRTGIDIYAVPTGKRLGALPTDPLTNVRALCWGGPANRWIIAGERFNESIVAIDPETRRVRSIMVAGAAYPRQLAPLRNGRISAAGFEDGHIRLLNISGGFGSSVSQMAMGVVKMQFQAHQFTSAREDTQTGVAAIASCNRSQFVTAGYDGSVCVWDLDEIQARISLNPPSHVVEAVPVATNEILYFANGPELGSAPVRVSSQGRNRTHPDEPDYGNGIVFGVGNVSQQGWIPIRFDTVVQIRNVRTGKILGSMPVKGGTSHPNRVAISPAGTRVAFHATEEEVAVWETDNEWQTSARIQTIPAQPRGGLLFADSGQTLIFDQNMDHVVEWDLEARRERSKPTDLVGQCLAISTDESMLASDSFGGFTVIDRRSGDKLMQARGMSEVSTLRFSDQDRILITGHKDGKIRAWHLPTGDELGILFEPARLMGSPESLSFFPPGNRLLVRYEQLNKSELLIIGAEIKPDTP